MNDVIITGIAALVAGSEVEEEEEDEDDKTSSFCFCERTSCIIITNRTPLKRVADGSIPLITISFISTTRTEEEDEETIVPGESDFRCKAN